MGVKNDFMSPNDAYAHQVGCDADLTSSGDALVSRSELGRSEFLLQQVYITGHSVIDMSHQDMGNTWDNRSDGAMMPDHNLRAYRSRVVLLQGSHLAHTVGAAQSVPPALLQPQRRLV